MGEAPVREDGTVTRSAEVTPWISLLFVCLSVLTACVPCEVRGLVSRGRPVLG